MAKRSQDHQISLRTCPGQLDDVDCGVLRSLNDDGLIRQQYFSDDYDVPTVRGDGRLY